MAERERYTRQQRGRPQNKVRGPPRNCIAVSHSSEKENLGTTGAGPGGPRQGSTHRRHGADDAEEGQPKRATVGGDRNSCSTAVVDVATDE